MKENKVFICLLGVVFLILGICLFLSFYKGNNDIKKSDAIIIKELYESKNDEDGYVKVSLGEDNPFVQKSEEEIVKILKEKTGIIVFATHESNASRSVISLLSDVAHELKYGSISYLDVKDVRDEYSLDNLHNTILDKDGTKGYKHILEVLDEELMPYIIENSDGTKVNVGESRIYMPTIVAVYNGKIQSVHTITTNEDKIIDEKEKDNLKGIFKTMIESVTDELCDDAC